ncbi:hypothetical protein [Clostridium intestinale]|jgi:putative Mn2+ efflux pump MntP|uniref:DUF3784 domain-containing protein n=1 Tax=Clostridium intestinale TaxID=36845 RepID=A0A7D6VNL4_9CLOT|nr:hypothetical protein [Clostridium intestinale]QLY78546.1 hypothetical protein HZF06_15825 [Clostridium intestinale]
MRFKIIGIIFIGVACLGLFLVFKNKRNMPQFIRGLRRDRYEIIDEEKFNNIMIVQSISTSLWCLTIGVSALFKLSRTILTTLTWIFIVSILLCNYFSRKYIRKIE